MFNVSGGEEENKKKSKEIQFYFFLFVVFGHSTHEIFFTIDIKEANERDGEKKHSQLSIQLIRLISCIVHQHICRGNKKKYTSSSF